MAVGSTRESVRQLIVTEFTWPGDSADLADDYPLLERGVIDSLGMHQLVAFLESTYDIEIDDEDLVPENFETLAAIAGMVDRKSAENVGAAAQVGSGADRHG
jgi:acyl carrier protein